MIGLSVMGIAAPTIMDISIAPVIAQKRANNFGIAESAAVIYAAKNANKTSLSAIPDNCDRADLGDRSYEISCRGGEGKYQQIVKRSFRLQPDDNNSPGDNNSTTRRFPYDDPGFLTRHHQCPETDPYGVEGTWINTYGKKTGCMPQAAWTKTKYLASNPDSWLYDINNIKGYGPHPDY